MEALAKALWGEAGVYMTSTSGQLSGEAQPSGSPHVVRRMEPQNFSDLAQALLLQMATRMLREGMRFARRHSAEPGSQPRLSPRLTLRAAGSGEGCGVILRLTQVNTAPHCSSGPFPTAFQALQTPLCSRAEAQLLCRPPESETFLEPVWRLCSDVFPSPFLFIQPLGKKPQGENL